MMAPQVKIFIILLLLFHLSSFGRADSLKDGMELITYSPDHEVSVGILVKGRKLLIASLDAMLDYQEPGANPGHDPHRGNAGGRGGNNP